jgi:hypothetical protein
MYTYQRKYEIKLNGVSCRTGEWDSCKLGEILSTSNIPDRCKWHAKDVLLSCQGTILVNNW